MNEQMNIGEAARSSGVSAKMLRHYAEIGLIPATQRTLAGYRVYSTNDVHTYDLSNRRGILVFQLQRYKNYWRCGKTVIAPAEK